MLVGLRGSPTLSRDTLDLGVFHVVHHVGHASLGASHVGTSPSSCGTRIREARWETSYFLGGAPI